MTFPLSHLQKPKIADDYTKSILLQGHARYLDQQKYTFLYEAENQHPSLLYTIFLLLFT
jgi:hypothetical protein